MNKHKNSGFAEELTDFLLKMGEYKDKNALRKEACELINLITPRDFEQAERKLEARGVSREKIQHLSASFIMMGLLESEKVDLRSHLPDYHVLRKVMAEHDMLRCFLADLEDITVRIDQIALLKSTSSEFMRLCHIVEHLHSFLEHISREDDVLFPAITKHGWASLFAQIQTEHTYIQMTINDLVKLVMAFHQTPFHTFKNRLLSNTRYLCPLLREHLFHEDRILFPLSISLINNQDVWDELRHICNEIDYCGIHL